MINLHSIIVAAIYPGKVRPSTTYIDNCVTSTNAGRIELSDTESIVVDENNGCCIIDNPRFSNLILFHLGIALTTGPKKINQLPSACDIIIHNEREIVIAELTVSNPRSILGVSGKPQLGKMEKAKSQLISTIQIIERTEFNYIPTKKTAIFFFRIPKTYGVAARSLNAFMQRPTIQRVTTHVNPNFPDWEFRSHPYPNPYTIL